MIFLVVAVVISQLVGRMQASLLAATARERESTQLYELSIALTAQRTSDCPDPRQTGTCGFTRRIRGVKYHKRGALFFLLTRNHPAALS